MIKMKTNYIYTDDRGLIVSPKRIEELYKTAGFIEKDFLHLLCNKAKKKDGRVYGMLCHFARVADWYKDYDN